MPVTSTRAEMPVTRQGEAVVMPTLLGIGYGNYDAKPTNFIFSFLLHMLVVLGIVVGSHYLLQNRDMIRQTVVQLVDPSDMTLPASLSDAGGGGGGGDHSKLEASKGTPPKFDLNQITPPAVVVKNPDPKLAVEQTLAVDPHIKLPTSTQVGDPLSAALILSNGIGASSGVGSGDHGGLGMGSGPGLGRGLGGNTGGGVFRIGGGVSAPKAIYSPEAEYSEEARKVKYQGIVTLQVVVGADGRPRDIRVQRSVGMGLDEKAVEAVKQWRFEPAKKDGKPVAVYANIEVAFNLY